MRPTKKLWARVGAGFIVAAAFASAAIAADSGAALGSGAGALSAAAASAVSGAAATSQTAASQTAARVIDAIAGGSDPSIAASLRSDPESRASAKGPSFNVISAAQGLMRAATAGTVGVRPGWGCGDKNHTHSGPPGRPDADSPCDKNR